MTGCRLNLHYDPMAVDEGGYPSRSDPPVCPLCGNYQIDVRYTLPATYTCRTCKASLRDINDRGVVCLSGEEGKRKRPFMYGLPACKDCSHAPHPDAPCDFCNEPPRVVRLVPKY